MKAADVVPVMRAIEQNIEAEVGVQSPPLDVCVATLLSLEHAGMLEVLQGEVRHIGEVMRSWYQRGGIEPSYGNYAGLGFMQGVTFAVAVQRLRDERRFAQAERQMRGEAP